MAEITEIRQLASQIVDDLAGGLSVLLTGLPGSGRSYLSRLVAQDLNHLHINAVKLRGNSLLADRPLSALSLSDPKGEDSSKANGPSMLAYAAGRLDALCDVPKSLLIVDDADEMDVVTAGLVANLRHRRKMPLLVIAGNEKEPGDVVDKLVAAAQPGVAVKLGGMSFEGVTRMVGRLLDGPVGAEAVSQIATLSGGLPGLIESIVHLGRRNGQLVRRDGTWVALDSLWDPGLRFSLLPLVRGLDQEEIKCLVHLAEDYPAAQLAPDKLHRLSQRGLFRCDQVAPAGCIFPPALAEWLRYDCDSHEPDSGQRHMSTVDMGRWPTNLTGPEAATTVDRMRTHWHAELARQWQAWSDNRVPQTAVPLLITLFAGGANDDRIALVMKRTRRDGADVTPKALLELTVLGAHYRALGLHDLDGAMAELRQVGQASPHLGARLMGYACHLILACRGVPQASLLAPRGEGLDDETLRVTRAEALIAQGQIDDALAQLTDFEPTLLSARIMKQTAEALALVLSDDVTAGVELAVKRLWDALVDRDVMSVSGHAYVAVLGMCILGRFDELQSIVEIMYRLGDSNIFQNRYKTGLFMLGHFVAGWQGRWDYARNLAMQAMSLSVATGPFPGMLANDYHGWSGDEQWDAVDDLLERGFLTAAIFLAVPAVEADPMTQRAEPVIRQGAACQSPILRALSQYIATIVSGELDDFPDTVAQLRQSCGPLDVTRANVTWSLLLRERGEGTDWLAKAADAWEESNGIAGHCDGLFSRLIEAVNLTEREAEVARLASEGLSSHDIADAMGIAMRTIEAHLHSTYRKTGVSNREQLRRLVDTWLNLPTSN